MKSVKTKFRARDELYPNVANVNKLYCRKPLDTLRPPFNTASRKGKGIIHYLVTYVALCILYRLVKLCYLTDAVCFGLS